MSKSIKDTFVHVKHPEFEVHNFYSLSEATGYSATRLAVLYSEGAIEMIATNFYRSKNMFAIAKGEIERLKALRLQSKMYLGRNNYGRSNRHATSR